jgi:hypothetical protein
MACPARIRKPSAPRPHPRAALVQSLALCYYQVVPYGTLYIRFVRIVCRTLPWANLWLPLRGAGKADEAPMLGQYSLWDDAERLATHFRQTGRR